MPYMPPITTNWTTTSTTHAAVTGMSFPVAAGRNYEFKFFVPASTGSTTVGIGFAINTPGSDTRLGWTAQIPSSTTAMTILNSSSDSPDPGNSANLATTGINVCVITGYVTPSLAGEIQLMAETESGTLTIYPGAYPWFRDVTA